MSYKGTFVYNKGQRHEKVGETENVFNLTFHYVTQKFCFFTRIKQNAYEYSIYTLYIGFNGHYFTDHEDEDGKIAKTKKLDRKIYINVPLYIHKYIILSLATEKLYVCLHALSLSPSVYVCTSRMVCGERRNVSFDLYSNICVEIFFILISSYFSFLSHHFTLEDAM